MTTATVREGFVPGITPHPVSDALVARKYSTAEMLAAAERRVNENRTLIEYLNQAILLMPLEPGDQLRIKALSSTAGDQVEALKGKVVEVTRVELRASCMTGVMIHFRNRGKDVESPLDLGWFEAVGVRGCSHE